MRGRWPIRLPAAPGRRATWLTICLGVALCLPGLSAGWLADDYVHVAALDGRLPDHGQGLDLFNFADGNPAHLATRIDHGPYPWWTAPDLRLRFFRPLSSLLLHLDHALDSGNAVWSHAHSLLWFGLCLGAVATLLGRALGGRLAVLAAVLYAVDDAHWMPAVWLANRNALVATAPALWGLCAWLRWREDGWRPGAWLWPVGLAVGLAGGETALGVVALMAAYEAVAWRKTPGRWRGWLPTAGVLLAWAVPYKLLHFGAQGSGAYLDPLATPLAFAAQAPGRVLALIGAMGLGVPVDVWAASPHLGLPLALCGVVALGVFAALWRRLGDGLASRELRGLAWLSVGGALALLPAAATFPANRLLTVPSIAGAAWVAWALLRIGTLGPRAVATGWPRVAGVWLTGMHLVVAPLMLVIATGGIGVVSRAAERSIIGPTTTALGGRIAVLPLAPDPFVGVYPLPIMLARNAIRPERWWCLSMTRADHAMVRTGARTLQLSSLGEPMLTSVGEQLLRSPRSRFAVGDTVRTAGYQATVLALREGMPQSVRFDFARDLDDPLYAWLQWTAQGLRPLAVPRVGATVTLTRHPGVLGF